MPGANPTQLALILAWIVESQEKATVGSEFLANTERPSPGSYHFLGTECTVYTIEVDHIPKE